MPRINYLLFSSGGMQGGHKMIVRHVETLRDLGFDAVVYLGRGSVAPTWFEHRAPIVHAEPVTGDDIIVAPDDGRRSIRQCAEMGVRTHILSQNPYYFGATAFDEVDRFPADNVPTFLAVAPRLAATLKRAFPQSPVEVVPCFADERIFRPGAEKRDAIVYAPKKRTIEAQAIRSFVRKFHPRHSAIDWVEANGLTERQMAHALAEASLCLSLSRLESVGMTTLEAMASGCVCAGFLGVGGAEYATPENGFWVPEDDCEAAADALAEAADLVATGGPALKARLEAGYEAARRWSYANFRQALEAAWMRIAPEARLRDGPLDEAAA